MKTYVRLDLPPWLFYINETACILCQETAETEKNCFYDLGCVLCEVWAEAEERVEHRVSSMCDCNRRVSTFGK
jgi:hypothetical protein